MIELLDLLAFDDAFIGRYGFLTGWPYFNNIIFQEFIIDGLVGLQMSLLLVEAVEYKAIFFFFGFLLVFSVGTGIAISFGVAIVDFVHLFFYYNEEIDQIIFAWQITMGLNG